jgi:hypothetical protein
VCKCVMYCCHRVCKYVMYCCHRVCKCVMYCCHRVCKCVMYCCHRVCKCVMYCCHRVSTQLRFTVRVYIISYHIISYHIVSYIISYRIISYWYSVVKYIFLRVFLSSVGLVNTFFPPEILIVLNQSAESLTRTSCFVNFVARNSVIAQNT